MHNWAHIRTDNLSKRQQLVTNQCTCSWAEEQGMGRNGREPASLSSFHSAYDFYHVRCYSQQTGTWRLCRSARLSFWRSPSLSFHTVTVQGPSHSSARCGRPRQVFSEIPNHLPGWWKMLEITLQEDGVISF